MCNFPILARSYNLPISTDEDATECSELLNHANNIRRAGLNHCSSATS
jgi:hypothetical protein